MKPFRPQGTSSPEVRPLTSQAQVDAGKEQLFTEIVHMLGRRATDRQLLERLRGEADRRQAQHAEVIKETYLELRQLAGWESVHADVSAGRL